VDARLQISFRSVASFTATFRASGVCLRTFSIERKIGAIAILRSSTKYLRCSYREPSIADRSFRHERRRFDRGRRKERVISTWNKPRCCRVRSEGDLSVSLQANVARDSHHPLCPATSDTRARAPAARNTRIARRSCLGSCGVERRSVRRLLYMQNCRWCSPGFK